MIEDTINEDKTISGGGKDVTLAGRYRSQSWARAALEHGIDRHVS